MTLGEIIAKYRKEHDMSMRAFARAAGLSVTYISSLENGVTQRGNKPAPSLETYKAIAKAMGMDIDTLLRAIDDDIKIMPTSIGEHKLSAKKQVLFDLIDSLPDEKVEAILRLLGEE